MKQQIIRSFQNGKGTGADHINDLLEKGWVVKSSHVVTANGNFYGYVEYVLEYISEKEEKHEDRNL